MLKCFENTRKREYEKARKREYEKARIRESEKARIRESENTRKREYEKARIRDNEKEQKLFLERTLFRSRFLAATKLPLEAALQRSRSTCLDFV
ncbi:hypothetical protein SVI_0626 [Shewanella violacea DSS12]|uniref:Uncharacterized protein n=1 Tax=Shewanella violacea (strain JCM 10179 / CIP 106290 / LMG 19151 / DSS12) TaxID=637905 RepID=D4ZFZ8_SHEVD|nr:hypothetical protein SVI_0626 [Shewanella violacea DSS12]